MRFGISFLFIIFLIACSHGQNKYLSEAAVLKIYEKKYDSLRPILKDSLKAGISNVNDYEQVFTGIEKLRLDSIIRDFKRKTNFQVVVFTFDSLMTSEDSVDQVTQIVGTKNQINTTIGLAFPYRKMYIWNDSLINKTVLDRFETKDLIDEKFIPYFKNGEYFNGTFEGIKALIRKIINNRKDNDAKNKFSFPPF
jgi:uncharacterized protein